MIPQFDSTALQGNEILIGPVPADTTTSSTFYEIYDTRDFTRLRERTQLSGSTGEQIIIVIDVGYSPEHFSALLSRQNSPRLVAPLVGEKPFPPGIPDTELNRAALGYPRLVGGAIPNGTVVRAWPAQVLVNNVPMRTTTESKKARVLKLLDDWLSESPSDEEEMSLQSTMASLDANRPSARKLFPEK